MGKKFTVGYVAEFYDRPLAAGENGENPDDILEPNAAAPQVQIGDMARATFGESDTERQAHQEMTEFDVIFKGLRDESSDLFRTRAKEIADAAVPVTRI
jgi:hypothetical protein